MPILMFVASGLVVTACKSRRENDKQMDSKPALESTFHGFWKSLESPSIIFFSKDGLFILTSIGEDGNLIGRDGMWVESDRVIYSSEIIDPLGLDPPEYVNVIMSKPPADDEWKKVRGVVYEVFLGDYENSIGYFGYVESGDRIFSPRGDYTDNYVRAK